MNQPNINHGSDCDVGIQMSRRPRDGTDGNARDRTTDGMPRDGTGGKPRDGTERRPRDGTRIKPRDATERRPRDGTWKKSRDGTEKSARDGTLRRPRDGTNSKPRDNIIQLEGNLARARSRRKEYPPGAQTLKRPTTKRRDLWGGYVGLMDRHGRGMPC